MQIAAFIRYLVPELRQCPDEMLRVFVVDAITDLCQHAKVWRQVQDPQPLQDGVRDYQPDLPGGARVVRVEKVFCGAREVHGKTFAALTRDMPDWQTSEGNEPYAFVGAEDWLSINVYPLPRNPTASITMRVEFEPLVGAESMPDPLLQRFRGEVAAYVKAEAMMMSGVAWSNPALSTFWRKRYEDMRGKVKIAMIRERTGGTTMVHKRAFG